MKLELKPSEIAFIRDRLIDAIREINPSDTPIIQEADRDVNSQIKHYSKLLTKRISNIHQNKWE